jgi:hypothetical protein
MRVGERLVISPEETKKHMGFTELAGKEATSCLFISLWFYPQVPAIWPCCQSPTSEPNPAAFQPMALATPSIPRAWSLWPALQFPFLGGRARPRIAPALVSMAGPAEEPLSSAWALPNPLRPRTSQVLALP